jgi:aerobic carbon-monoxide dehydrogenase medium subunit
LVTEVELPVLKDGTRVGFSEFSRRAGDFAVAMVLATYRVENGRIVETRISVGGAEVAPRRISEAEVTLVGRTPTKSSFEATAEAAAAAVQPFDDNNNTVEFRRGLVLTLAQRALENAS